MGVIKCLSSLCYIMILLMTLSLVHQLSFHVLVLVGTDHCTPGTNKPAVLQMLCSSCQLCISRFLSSTFTLGLRFHISLKTAEVTDGCFSLTLTKLLFCLNPNHTQDSQHKCVSCELYTFTSTPPTSLCLYSLGCIVIDWG